MERDTREELGARLFTFAVVADTHVNQKEGEASSDFAVNRLANARTRRVLHEINRIAPAFVLHLGDIVHPTPIHPGYGVASEAFHALAGELRCPIYLTPGNHDVGDKPGDWLPVPSVNDAFLALYRRHFGPSWQGFDANGCRFVIIDAQIVNSGLACEAEQRAWLERELGEHHGRRIFLTLHYPPFLRDAEEEGHYDNIDEPGRSWLLGLFERYAVEAVFAGHVHNFWYHRHRTTDLYLLPSTSFVRLDYSELFRIGPAPERGRNDAPKLGFMAVDVHERGHVAHTVRTFGATLAPGGSLDAAKRALPRVHTKSIRRAPVGIDLRYPWAETVEVAASGALDEFTRKMARNDYPLMSLWEMGVRRLRVPLHDLVRVQTRSRMRELVRIGHQFTVYTLGCPSGAAREALVEHADLVAGWDVITAWRDLDATLERVREVKRSSGIPVRLSRLRRHDEAHHHGVKSRHVIEHGFLLGEEVELRERIARAPFRDCVDALLFRIARERSPWDDLLALEAAGAALGLPCTACVRLATDNPAQPAEDDLATANRVAETVAAAHACRETAAYLDTLNDVDRGYYPRGGLVDRRFNPRLAGRVFQHLTAALEAAQGGLAPGPSIASADLRVITLEGAAERRLLLLPGQAIPLDRLRLPQDAGGGVAEVRWIDLAAGEVEAVRVSRVAGDGGDDLVLASPRTLAAPVLIELSR